MIINRAKDYYENSKERLRVQAREKYQHFSEEEKNKKYRKIDITVCLKKRKKTKRISKKLSRNKKV